MTTVLTGLAFLVSVILLSITYLGHLYCELVGDVFSLGRVAVDDALKRATINAKVWTVRARTTSAAKGAIHLLSIHNLNNNKRSFHKPNKEGLYGKNTHPLEV